MGLLATGRNVWRTAAASRVAFLVDACAYYDAFAAAVASARRQVLIVGWDFDTRTPLGCLFGPPGSLSGLGGEEGPAAGLPVELGAFLAAVLARRPELSVHVLAWDYNLIYAFERELLQSFRVRSPRLDYCLDKAHPAGASQHQKLVVIDDTLAFVGGLDLCLRRWDTPEHRACDLRRLDTRGEPYGPFHDVQVAVEGDVARALGDLARERWRRATGVELAPPPAGPLVWPWRLAAELRDVPVGIARTEPCYAGRPAVREVEALYLDAIDAAARWIYIENQFLTAASIAAALEASLRRPRGPEIVIVGPGRCSGWLEERTMGVLRARLLERLVPADTHRRLRLLSPVADGGALVNLHSKVFIVDDRLVRVGSANLSNRSMSLDSECDIAIEAAAGDTRAAAGIASLRHRLVAEHLGRREGAVAEAQARLGSLIGAVEALSGDRRGLRPLELRRRDAEPLPHEALADSLQPLEPGHVIAQFVPEPIKEQRRQPFMRVAIVLVALLGVAATWHFTPVGQWIDVPRVLAMAATARASALAPLATAAAFILGNLVLVPVTLLVVQSGALFGPLLGALYSLTGALLSAALAYWLGRAVGHDVVFRLARGRLRSLSRVRARRTLLLVIAIRLLPIAPFIVINMAAGATRMRFRYYMLGTLIGMSPGVIALSIFGHQLGEAIRRPNVLSFAVLATLLALIMAAGMWFRRRFLTPAPVLAESHVAGD